MSTLTSFCNLKYVEFKKELSAIEEKDISLLEKSQASILLCVRYLEDLKQEVQRRGLPSEKDDLSSFQLMYIQISSEYIFHIDLYNFRKSCPAGDINKIKAHIRHEQKKIMNCLENPKTYDKYYKFNLDHNDQSYSDDFLPGIELQFTSKLDAVLSRMIAGKRLHDLLGKIVDTGDLSLKTTAPWMDSSEKDIMDTRKESVGTLIHELYQLKFANTRSIIPLK